MEAGSDAPHRARIDPWVFWTSAAISAAFVLWGVVDSGQRRRALPTAR